MKWKGLFVLVVLGSIFLAGTAPAAGVPSISFSGTGMLGTDPGTGSQVLTGSVLRVDAIGTPLNGGVYSPDPAYLGAPVTIGVDLGFAFLSCIFDSGMELASVPFLGAEAGQAFALPYNFLQTGIFDPAPPTIVGGVITGSGIDFMTNPDYASPSVFSTYFGLAADSDLYTFQFSANPSAAGGGLYDFALVNTPVAPAGTPVPEPGTIPLLAMGLIGMAFLWRRETRG